MTPVDDPNYQDFKMIDLLDAVEVEIVSDSRRKLWINVNGKCLLRVGSVQHLTISTPEEHKRKAT